jgi:ribonucleoside-diphosphate reductase alpha chain
VKDLAKGVYVYKNPYLITLLQSYGKDDQETWDSILKRGGSVQHLDFLTQNEKDVFKAFGEISQLEVVTQAAQRQSWIDQSQSINMMVSPQELAENVAKLIITFWRLKGKTLYYQRSVNPAQQLSRNNLACKSCEG